MRSINLVPKVPFFQKVFVPVLTAVISIAVLGSGAMILYSANLHQQLAQQEDEVRHLTAGIQAETARKTITPETAAYNKLLSAASGLQQSRVNWLPAVDLIVAALPEAARLTSLSAALDTDSAVPSNPVPNDTTTAPAGIPVQIEINVQISGMQPLAEYMIRLHSSPLVKDVSIANMLREEKTPSAPDAPAAQNEGAARQAPMKLDEFNYSQADSLPEEASEGDAILNELRWLMLQQMAKQQHGIQLPDRGASTSYSFGEEGNSVITEEDIANARRELEQFKNSNPSEAGSSSEERLDFGESETPANHVIRTVKQYNATLTIKMALTSE